VANWYDDLTPADDDAPCVGDVAAASVGASPAPPLPSPGAPDPSRTWWADAAVEPWEGPPPHEQPHTPVPPEPSPWSGGLTTTASRRVPALDVRDVTVALPDGTVVVDDISIRVPAGSLVAVVGPTGAGKSTLLKAITGASPPSFGVIDVEGQDLFGHLEELRPRIGSVPQDDIVHVELTVRDALSFGAELRRASAPPAERTQRVEQIIHQLGLEERADLQISKLSGGQRKRTSVALELLGEPAVIVLDEPTSGLDPGFEQSVMMLFRRLADAGKALIVVTHAVASLELCDQVVFLAPGGRVAFAGPPSQALDYFSARDYPEVFHQLSENASPNRRVDPTCIPPTADVCPASLAPSAATAHLRTLIRRQTAVLRADRRNLAFIIGAPIALAVLILMVVGTGVLDQARGVISTDARTLLGAIGVAAAALGASNAVREIVREEPLYRRERALGVPRVAYLASKVLVTGAVTTAQVTLLVLVTTIAQGAAIWGHVLPTVFELALAFSLTGLATVGIGLTVSAVVSSSEKAMTVVPVLFVLCYLFSGAAVDLESQPAMKVVSYTIPVSWGVAAAASTVELPAIENCGGQAVDGGVISCDGRWDASTWTWLSDMFFLCLLAVGTVIAADAALARKEPLPAMRRDHLARRAWVAVRAGVETQASRVRS
jgi:ABC-type multidrug transport system ATPase subunit